MSASGADQVQVPVLVATDPVISHEVPVPVDGQILKDVSNLGSNETPESVAAGLVSLNKANASNGAVGHTKSLMKTSADEKENAPSHEQSASVEDGVFVDDKEMIIHGSDIALEKTKDVVEADNAAASDSITTDNADDTTLNEKDNDIIAVKDIPSTSEVESVATVEHVIPADSDLIAPIAKITEANTIDDSVNDSAIEIPTPVLEKNQGCAKDSKDDAVPADDMKLAETGNHNEAVHMDERVAPDNVDGAPEIMNQALNGETLTIAEVALQEKGNVDVDIASSAAEGDALDIDAMAETKEENASIAIDESNVTDSVVAQVDAADISVEPAASIKDSPSSDHIMSTTAASELVVETQEHVSKASVEDIVEQTQAEAAPAAAEEQMPAVQATPTEADLKEDGAVVATETENAIESNDAGIMTGEVEQGGVDETSVEPMDILDAEPLVEEVEVGHEVEPAAEDVSNIEGTSSHEEPVRSAVEEEPKVTEVDVGVIEEIHDSGEDAVVAVDETTEAPKTVEKPTNGISTAVEVGSISSEVALDVEVTYEEGRPVSEVEPMVVNETIPAEPVDAGTEVGAEAFIEEVSAPVDGESVPASEKITAPSDTVHEAASEPVEEGVVPASAVIAEPVIESEDVVPTAEDETVTPEMTNEEASVKVEAEPVTADAEVFAPVDEPVTTGAVAEVGNEEASVQVATEPIATPVDELIASVVECEVPYESAAVCVEAEPGITAPVIESEEVAQTSDETRAAAPETSVETDEEAPVTIEVQYVENIAEEANEETTVSVLAEPVAETEGVTEEASEKAGQDDVTQEAPGSVEPDSISTSDEVAATVVEVPEEPVRAPVESSEEIFATTMNVENQEIPASVDALAETTIVEAESAPIEAPVEIAVAASLEAEQGEAASIVAEDDSEPSVPGEELSTTIPEAAPQVDETTHAEPSAPMETESVTASGDIATFTTQVETAVIEIQQPQSLAENAESAADVLELAGKEGIDIGSTGVSALEAEAIVSATGQGDDVAVEESTSAPVVQSVAVKEKLRTGVISIETSLDTTPFTPVLDSGIGFKEQESAPSTLSSIAEEFEKPKSSWRPSSFQFSTVGGVESSGVDDAGPVPESTELAETGEPASVPLLVAEDAPVNQQFPTIGASEDFISIDQPSLEQPPKWTASYSVHSQGSPTRVDLAEDFSSITHEPATATHELLLEELASIPVEEDFTAEVINHKESFERITEDATSTAGHVPSGDLSEPTPADLTEVGEGGLEVAVEEDANENADQEANQEVEAELTVDDPPARPWTPSYSSHSQGTPLIATRELEDVPPASVMSDVVLSAERSVENHAENAVTVDPEHDNTVDDQINTTEGEVHGRLSTEVSHVDPVIALEGQKIEDETMNPQQSSQAETEPLAAEFDKGETPNSVEQPQNNNIVGVVAAAIAPAIAIAALGARIRGLVPVDDEEVPQVDAALTVDTTAVPLLSVPSEVVGADATEIIVDELEGPRSPWTPSYKVKKQDNGLSQKEEAEVDHLEPLPPAAAQAATTSDSEPLLNEVQEDEPDSNALQTRPSFTVAGTEEIAKNEQFFLFGLRAIVAYLWVLPKWLSMTPSDHSRRGSSSSSSSSSSSKLFPGGWFTPKPNEGHTSLDVAQGEFASPKATTSNDVFETLGSEVTDSSAAINVAAEDDGRKRKWCVVM